MQLTPYEKGERSPEEHIAKPRPKVEYIPKMRKRQVLSLAERQRRQRLAVAARKRFPSSEAFGRALGTDGSNTGKWYSGERPVPDKYVATLESLAEMRLQDQTEQEGQP